MANFGDFRIIDTKDEEKEIIDILKQNSKDTRLFSLASLGVSLISLIAAIVALFK